MKKGFTLIELLAVIVILAIIALIATPIVLNIINDTKESAVLRSADFYIDALENEIMLENMKQGGSFNPNVCTITKGTVSCDGKEITLKADGEVPSSGSITFEEGKVKDVNLTYSNGTVTLNNKGELVLSDNDIPESKSFAEDSWETIAKLVKKGEISNYNVGDTKTIDMGTYGTQTVRIANTSTPSECSTTGYSQSACGFVIEFQDIITYHAMNDENANVGGWKASSMRTFVNADIYNALPEELRKVIIETTVVSGHGLNDSANFTTTDKLYLLSTKEIWGKDGADNVIEYDTAEAETRQLDYYKNMGVSTDSYDGAMKEDGSWWWLRSAHSRSANGFFGVYANGYWNGYAASNSSGVSPAFRIG